MQEIVRMSDLYNMDLRNAKEVQLGFPNYNVREDVLDFARIAPNAEKIVLQIIGGMDSKNISLGSKVQYFGVETMFFGEIMQLSGRWHFAEKVPNAKQIELRGFDMKNVTHLEFGPNVQRLSMENCRDFYYIPHFDIGVANIKSINFEKIAPNAQEINLHNSDFGGVTGLNFGPNVKKINLSSACFSDMNFAENAPNAQEIDLRGVYLRSAVGGITANIHTKLLLDNRGNPNVSFTVENGIIKMYVQRERY